MEMTCLCAPPMASLIAAGDGEIFTEKMSPPPPHPTLSTFTLNNTPSCHGGLMSRQEKYIIDVKRQKANGVLATAARLVCIPFCLEVTFCKCHPLRGGAGDWGDSARNERSHVSSDLAVAVDTEIMRRIGH